MLGLSKPDIVIQKTLQQNPLIHPNGPDVPNGKSMTAAYTTFPLQAKVDVIYFHRLQKRQPSQIPCAVV